MQLINMVNDCLIERDKVSDRESSFWVIFQNSLLDHISLLDNATLWQVEDADVAAAYVLLSLLEQDAVNDINSTDFMFPKFSKCKFTTNDQLAKIDEERLEAVDAFKKWMHDPSNDDLRDSYIFELLDIMHACETAIRHELKCDKIPNAYIDEVVTKNKERGYYD